MYMIFEYSEGTAPSKSWQILNFEHTNWSFGGCQQWQNINVWISNMLMCLLLVNLQNPSLLYPSKTVLNLGRTQIFAGKLEFHNLFLVCFFALFLLISGIHFCTKPINYERVLALTHFLKKHEKISKKGDKNYVISFAKILVGVARFFPYTRWVAFVSY